MRPNALANVGPSSPKSVERFQAATVANGVSPGQDLYALLDSMPDQPVGPIKGWPTRSTPVSRGDGLLVVRVGDGDWWFVTWDIPGWKGGSA